MRSTALAAWVVPLAVTACTSPSGGDKPADSGWAETGGDSASAPDTGDTADSGDLGESGDTADTADSQDSGESASGTEETGDTSSEPRRWVAAAVCTSGAALDQFGHLMCFGLDMAGSTECPSGEFVEVDVGFVHGCAIDPAGGVTCWGADPNDPFYGPWSVGQADPPAGVFHGISVGELQSCALDDADSVVCWGRGEPEWQPPGGVFAKVAVGHAGGCALDFEGEVACWGEGFLSELALPGPWVDVLVGSGLACGLDDQGHVECWGIIDAGAQDPPPHPKFANISGMYDSSCGLTRAGQVRCWGPQGLVGLGDDLQAWQPREGVWIGVSMGLNNACVWSAAGELYCFGNWYPDGGDPTGE